MLGYTTDRWTDTVPFHRPCSAYYTSSTNILWRTFISYLRDLITHLAKDISLLDTAVTAGPYWLQVEGDSWLKSVWLGSNGLRANERQQFLSCPWRQKNSYFADDSLQANIISSLSKVPRSILTNYGNTLAVDMHGTCDEKSFLLICGAKERNVQAFVRRKCQFKPRDEYDTRRLYL